MSDKPQNEYLKAKIMTASPEQLHMMLYDGAIRFCEQAKQAMAEKDIPTTHDRCVRAQKIVLELSNGLDKQANPDLCGKLAGLYNYLYRLLIQANLNKDPAKIDEALELLRYQRDTWEMALEKAREELADFAAPPEPARKGNISKPQTDLSEFAKAAPKPVGKSRADQLVGGTLSVEG